MTPLEMEDNLRPTDKAYKAIYEKAYKTWYRLWAGAAKDYSLPLTCLEAEQLFIHHPVLPVGLDPDDSGLVTAKSTWISSEGCCDIPPFEQTLQMVVIAATPTPIILTSDPSLTPFQWVGKDDGHLTVLVLAWAYALSARWAEIIPRASPIEYTTSQAPWIARRTTDEASESDRTTVVNLGNPSSEAARWWAAVLAPGEGWRTAIPHVRWRLLSPWSVIKESNSVPISITGSPSCTGAYSSTPASFEMAMQYIKDYSTFHNTNTQCRAALAAALLLPVARLDKRKIMLYAAPRPCKRRLLQQPGEKSEPEASFFEEHCQPQFDRLLTLSANAHGMKTVLGSVFYEPGIPANICGAWLQGTMAVLQSKGAEDLHILGRMLFDRSPHISYLWLGGIITGAHKDFLQNTFYLLGLNRIDIHAAAWTGTLLSFIQEPVSPSHHDSKSISRADECRLMYLTQEPPRQFPPIFPYPLLGNTDIKDADLGVQLHAHCPGKHRLQFVSITWNCIGGKKDVQRTYPIPVASRKHVIQNLHEDEDMAIEVDYSWLDREKDHSEDVTRNLFTWMRDMDGFTIAERDIRQHEWIDAFDSSDDESVDPEGDGGSTTGLNTAGKMGRWVANTVTRRCNSL
ncbi:hypothetical protein GGS26DRAFT_551935 [Hypomontagnella submonticulosa]|nr:hypothetical protein GGS26DRAFT_551935 [Hypomontagnella submonticulosa]